MNGVFFFLALCFGVRILPQQFLHLKGLEPYWSSECLGIPDTYTCHWNIAYTTRKPTTAVWAIQILDGKIIYRLINGRGSFIARFDLQQIGALEKKKFSWYWPFWERRYNGFDHLDVSGQISATKKGILHLQCHPTWLENAGEKVPLVQGKTETRTPLIFPRRKTCVPVDFPLNQYIYLVPGFPSGPHGGAQVPEKIRHLPKKTKRWIQCQPRTKISSPIYELGRYTPNLILLFYPFVIIQWEFQDPKMEVPTIYKAYIRAM